MSDAFQLRATEGWQNLQAILQSTGERIPKRPRDADVPLEKGEPLAKRFAAFRLRDSLSPKLKGRA